jgi:hypothetical protein
MRVEPRNGHRLGDLVEDQTGDCDEHDEAPRRTVSDGASSAYRRSSRCLHFTHMVARGNTWSRALPIGVPHISHVPY